MNTQPLGDERFFRALESAMARDFRVWKSLGAIAVLVCVSSCTCFWIVEILPHQRFLRTHRRISERIGQFEKARPADVSEDQWEFVVGWTQTGHINCFSWRDKILDWKRFEAIPDELDRRIAAGPGLDTIDYLWDEFETVSTYGLKYSSKYRPTPARWEEWQRDRAPTPLASPE
jgi:hypothetical protein